MFYTQGQEEVLTSLESSREGLSTTEAKNRLEMYGRNELEEGKKRSLIAKFFDQFKDLMIIILLVAATAKATEVINPSIQPSLRTNIPTKKVITAIITIK